MKYPNTEEIWRGEKGKRKGVTEHGMISKQFIQETLTTPESGYSQDKFWNNPVKQLISCLPLESTEGKTAR